MYLILSWWPGTSGKPSVNFILKNDDGVVAKLITLVAGHIREGQEIIIYDIVDVNQIPQPIPYMEVVVSQ
jgi:hypothetical protein